MHPQSFMTHQRAGQGINLISLAMAMVCFLPACSESALDSTIPSTAAGPTVVPPSPRTDGATLLFSAFDADHQLASAQNPAFSPDGQRLVFTIFLNGYNTGPAELWIVDVDGSNANRITPVEDQDNVNVPGAAWSQTTREIVFASDRDDADDLWVIRPDGTGLRRITRHAPPPFWIEPSWSPDGAWIVFESADDATEFEARNSIFKVRANGSDLTQLTKLSGEDFDDRLPNWSPDGSRILFQRRDPHVLDGDNWDIFVINTDGGELTNVSRRSATFNTDNSWSPDGRWIAGSSVFPATGMPLPHPNIIAFFVPDAAIPNGLDLPIRITFSETHEDGAPSVSPNQNRTAFESHRTEDENSPSDLWMIDTPDALSQE